VSKIDYRDLRDLHRSNSAPVVADGMEAQSLLAARYLTRGAQITGVATMSLCLTWVSVSLRFYVRIHVLKFVGMEDWLTLVAMVGSANEL
jgi:hypothetical protein